MSHYYQQVISNFDYLETLKMNTNSPIKYKLADHMRNSMHIPDEFLEHLDIYRLTHWYVPQFKLAIKDGTLTPFIEGKEATTYSIIYYNTTPAAAKSAKEIRLSFRKAKPEFNIEPYVLVQIVSQD